MNHKIAQGGRRRGKPPGEPEVNLEDAGLQPKPGSRLVAMTPAQAAKVDRTTEVSSSKSGPVGPRAAADPPLPVRKMNSALMEAQRRFNAQVRMLLDALVNLEGHELQVEEIFEICGKLSTAMMPLMDGDCVSDRLALFTRHLNRNMSHLNKSQIIALRIGLKFVDTPQTQIECPYLTAIQGAAAKRVHTALPAVRRAGPPTRAIRFSLPRSVTVSASGEPFVPSAD